MDIRNCQKLLLFGGSFDPPHIGHVRLGDLARQAIDADLIAYIPAAQQPLKPHGPRASSDHRVAMLNHAIESMPRALVRTDEIDRGHKPSYSVETLDSILQCVGPNVQLRLLLGADQLRVFDKWFRWRRIIELAEPLVMLRPPDTRDSLLTSLPPGFDVDQWANRLAELPQFDVSSSQIRDRIARGQRIDHLVSPAVADYIRQHRLYAKETVGRRE